MSPYASIEPAFPADLPAISRLLAHGDLDGEGLDRHLRHAWVARAGGAVVGCAALEVYADGALLRSVAVAPQLRTRGVGARLVEVALERARSLGTRQVFLFTETAVAFFGGLGFAAAARAELPLGVALSEQVRGAACAGATVMRRSLPEPAPVRFGERVLAPIVLEGATVRLEPLSLPHTDELVMAGRDPEIFRFTTSFGSVEPPSREAMAEYVAEALAEQAAGRALPFAVVHRASGRVAGTTRYGAIAPRDRGLEVGWTWYALSHQRTAVNTECKFLLLRHAFDELGAVRVQLKTDARNQRSQAAIERIGARREGVLRAHMVLADGTLRDTVFYGVVRDDWPAVRARLLELLRRPPATG